MALKIGFKAKALDNSNMAMLRTITTRIMRRSKQLFESLIQGGETTAKNVPRPREVPRTEAGRSQYHNIHSRSSVEKVHTRNLVSRLLGPTAKVTQQSTLVAELRRKATQQLQSLTGSSRFLGRRVPLYAFVTLGLSGQLAGQEQEIGPEWDKGFHNVCEDIKSLFSAKAYPEYAMRESGLGESLADYEFGPLIAKGCNSAVYSVRITENQEVMDDNFEDHTSLESDITMASLNSFEETQEMISSLDSFEETQEMISSLDSFEDIQEESIEVISEDALDFGSDITFISESLEDDNNLNASQDVHPEDEAFNLAVKMMFNYDAQSNELSILRTMESELVPSCFADHHGNLNVWDNGNHVKKKRLPPHPNIVDIVGVFIDSVPSLPEAQVEYPAALPTRLNPTGCGRNKTLFLVMERYDQTLREYLQMNTPDLQFSLLLLTQLVESLVHLNRHQVAHRDIKSDNILLKVGEPQCHLVLTDFGCCLAEEHLGLVIPYFSDDTNKGGNGSLMAPEIINAEPSFSTYLDYRKSDLWAVGAVAYEIFGADNPFYRDSNGCHLDSRSYRETDLPCLPEHVPNVVGNLVKAMLNKDPKQRPDVETIANCLQLLLWMPAEWLTKLTQGGAKPGKVEVMRWLLTLSAMTCLQRSALGENFVDQNIKSLFLSRLDFSTVMQTFTYLWSFSQK